MKDGKKTFVSACLLASLMGPAWAENTGQIKDGDRELTLILLSGLSGRLQDDRGRTPAAVADAVRHEAEAARARGRSVLIVDAGRTLTPSVESRWDGGEAMVWVLSAAGCQVYAPDPMDVSAYGPGLQDLFAASGIQVLGPQVVAEDGSSSSLPQLARLDLGQGLTVEIRSIFDPGLAGELAVAGMGALAEELPQGGEGLSLAILHSAGTGLSLKTRQLTWSLVQSARGFDLLVDPDLGSDLILHRAGSEGPVGLLGRRREGDDWGRFAVVDLVARRIDGQWNLVDLDARFLDGLAQGDAEAPPAGRIRTHLAALEAADSHAFPESAPRTEEETRRFILQALGEAARAELVAINRGAIRRVSERFFAGDHLTREAVERMLALDQDFRVVTLTGAQLEELARDSVTRVRSDGKPRKDSLEFVGLELGIKDPHTSQPSLQSIEVNGRSLKPSDPYRVVTSSYLLLGGDTYSVLSEVGLSDSEKLKDFMEGVLMPRLEKAQEPFPNLERRGLWRYGVDRLALSFDGVRTDRDPAYEDSTDSRARAGDSGSFRGDFRVRADLDRKRMRWENRLLGSYGRQTTENETQETDDDLRFDTSLLLPKARMLGGEPFLAYTLDTEFRVDSDANGNPIPRQMEHSLTGGLSWTRPRWPRIRVGAAYRQYDNLDRDSQLGVTGEAHYLRPAKGRTPGVEMLLLAEHLSASDSNLSRLDLELRGLFPVYGSLAFSPALNYYILDDSAYPGSARYYRLSVGLTYDWSGKRQRW